LWCRRFAGSSVCTFSSGSTPIMELLGIAGFGLTVFGWVLYPVANKVPALRRTMWPLWVAFGCGLALAAGASAAAGFGDAGVFRWLIAAGINSACFLAVYMPRAAGRPVVGQALPVFSLAGEHGPFSPEDYAGKGPLLLVFFRGFW
jgi:hypothetical protein